MYQYLHLFSPAKDTDLTTPVLLSLPLPVTLVSVLDEDDVCVEEEVQAVGFILGAKSSLCWC